jgi:26S proteasome regulatory subunit N9
MRDVPAYLTAQVEATTANEELSGLWRQLKDYHQRRLWHQLTGILLELVKRPELQKSDDLWQLYTNVIADFELKLNTLSLVDICTPVVNRFEDAEEALQFLEKIGEKVKANTEAFVMTRVLIGKLQLVQFKDAAKTKAIVEEIDGLLNDVEGVGKVHAHYYLLATDYYKTEGDHANYYRAALRYLGCSELSDLSKEEQQNHAFHLSLAALLGKGIFNFGELLAHPILSALTGTPNEWLVKLLSAFNAGDVKTYENLRPQWTTQPDLNGNQEILYEKLCLLVLMEMTFRRDANDRQITFGDVAQQTGLAEDKVELLVMKALSKGLVKGQIDQVGQTINMTWVQPRVLDRDQIKTIMNKISTLSTSISSMETMIENNAGEILTV